MTCYKKKITKHPADCGQFFCVHCLELIAGPQEFMNRDTINAIQEAIAEGRSLKEFGLEEDDDITSSSYTNWSNSSQSGNTAPAPPPEIVYKVRGSTAGVGSEYFDQYRRMRRKEAYRLHAMQNEAEKVSLLSFDGGLI